MNRNSVVAVETAAKSGLQRAPGALAVSGLHKTYSGSTGIVQAIDNVSFELTPGEFVSVVGPSGGGKTTLLSCIAGLLAPTSGSVYLDGERVTSPPAGMSVVFQDYSRSLFPWLGVLSNVILPLRDGPLPKREAKARGMEMLSRVGLEAALVAHQYPWQLSGGMQQRIAIARALVSDPEVLLMDEPFASVDAQTRMELEDLLLELWSKSNCTILFVTHDIDEAIYVSDRVVVLSRRPASVVDILDISLERPRNQITTKEDPRFARLRANVLDYVVRSRSDGSTAL